MLRGVTLPVLLLALALMVSACEEDAGSGIPSVGATCQSTCEKSTALNCPADPTLAACVASCNGQKASCSAEAAAFQTYLDCIQTTAMSCGSTTQQASAPACVSQGLAIFACVLNGADGDSTEGE